MSLRVRVLAAIALVLLLGSAVGIGVTGWQAKRTLREELAAALAGARQTVESAFEDLPRSDHPARDLRQLVATFNGNRHLAAALLDEHGTILYASRAASTAPAPAWFRSILGDQLPDAHIPAPVAHQGTIVLRLLYANDVGALWREFVDLVAVLGASLLLSSIAVWLTVGRALQPLSAFSQAFERIGSGDYGATVPTTGPAELSRLGRGVNEMTRRLRAMNDRNRRLEEQLRTLQDEERADLARDLHDEIGPHLFAANVDASTAKRLIGDGDLSAALDRIGAIQEAVAHIQRLVRDILGRLRPTNLIDLGLTAAVGELVAFWRTRHPAVRFDIALPPDDAIDAARRETIYRIIQEGLNNAVRHGRPKKISVEVTHKPDGCLTARVSDDGILGEIREGGGFGLIGMRERVHAVKGELRIERGESGGWTLIATLPNRVGEEREEE